MMLNATHCQRNANQNHNEVPSHASQNGCYKKSMNNKCCRGCREKGTLLHCWWECKLVQPLWRTVWRFLNKLEIELQYDPGIPLLGIHTEETRIERDTCTPMFIAALLTIARTWKQPRCPSADEWIRKLWYMYTVEYYSAIKKNTFESVLMRWMKLELLYRMKVKVNSLSRVWLCDPWTVAHQAPPSMGFSRQEYWSGLPFPSPRIFQTQRSNQSLPHFRQTH